MPPPLAVVGSWLLAMGTATAIVYAWDKAKARRPGARRIPERTLHALTLAGGVGGAWLVFLGLGHKTRHRSFWVVQSLAAVLWAAVAAAALIA